MAKEKKGTPVNPSEQGSQSSKPRQRDDEQKQEPREGEYRNVETSVNNRSYFNDDYEVSQEEEISSEEANTEDENNVPNRRRNDG